MQEARAAWAERQKTLDPARLFFLDETWASPHRARRYGRAPRNERLIAHVPHGHWKPTTFVAALTLGGAVAPMVADGPIHGALCLKDVQEFLCPILKAGDIVAMENLSSHTVAGVREAIEARGARLLYRPPYSPDFNPIEQYCSKLKAALKKPAARTVEALGNARGSLYDEVTAIHGTHFFYKAG